MRSRLAAWFLSVGLVAGMSAPRADAAEPLTIGDPAPAIAVDKWVKGEKVEKFEPGKLYVVEFWATWCGPCKTSIPHLTELQKKYKGKVAFIGVSVFENEAGQVEPFVKEMGEKMEYAVATDSVPKGKGGDEGKMAEAWMNASQEPGIPTAFVVSKDGRIAWIGHPMSMEGPLEKIIAGNWDIQTAASERKEAKAREIKRQALFQTIVTAAQAKKYDEAIAAIDKAIAGDPEFAEGLAPTKFMLLAQAGKTQEALTYAAKLVEGAFKDHPEGLNQIAWTLLDPEKKEKPSPEAVKVALKAAQRAGEITKYDNGAILDTLALATFRSGDAAKAAEYQAKAIKLLGDQADDEVKGRLEEYRKAADKK